MKGVLLPQGLGRPIQSGMQEFTLWTAVVLVAKGGQFCYIRSFCILMRFYYSYLFLSLIIFRYSIYVSGVGGNPYYILFLAFQIEPSNSYLSVWNFIMFAWHIDNSEIVAFILRVKSLSLLWNQLIFSETQSVDCLPYVASFFSFQTKLVT